MWYITDVHNDLGDVQCVRKAVTWPMSYEYAVHILHVVTWTGKRAQSVSPCQQSSPTCSYTCTSAHMAHNTRHLAHNCEGGRLGYAPKSLSGHNPCLRSLSQEGRISKQLGWKGLASQFAPSPHLRGVSAAQRRGRLAHTCPTRPKKSIFEHQTRVLAAHHWRHLPLVTRDLHILPICQC